MKHYENTLNSLLEQAEDQISVFEIRRDLQDKKVLCLSVLQIFLTGLTTILLGITISNTGLTACIKNCAFISSVLAASLTAFMNQFKYQEERLITHRTLNLLKEVRAKIRLKKNQLKDDPENVILGKRETDELYEEFQSILSEGNLSWRQLMKTNPKKTEQASSVTKLAKDMKQSL
ncbi:MAG: SLATT domain-containing protein [Desulfobacterales bacterium]|nr:SLATT domain-containing protein [Desulfobacterales bacterium]